MRRSVYRNASLSSLASSRASILFWHCWLQSGPSFQDFFWGSGCTTLLHTRYISLSQHAQAHISDVDVCLNRTNESILPGFLTSFPFAGSDPQNISPGRKVIYLRYILILFINGSHPFCLILFYSIKRFCISVYYNYTQYSLIN